VLKQTDIPEVHTASIIRAFITLMMKVVCTSERSVCFETMWRYIPEGCCLEGGDIYD
jgi:hypothetical protein